MALFVLLPFGVRSCRFWRNFGRSPLCTAIQITNNLRDALVARLRAAGISVNTDWQEGERVLVRENGHTREMSRSQKRAMETASVSHDEEHQHAVISFADGAKV